jgi:hypothetical protein
MKTAWLWIAAAAGGAQPQAMPAPRIVETVRVERIIPCDMGWLAGSWRTPDRPGSAEAGAQVDEYWMPEAQGLMLGLGRAVTGKGPPSFEYMRIERAEDGAIRFYGSPQGAPAVAFRLSSCVPGWMTFENADHDYPQTITYRRQGDLLTASIARLDGSDRQTVRYERR